MTGAKGERAGASVEANPTAVRLKAIGKGRILLI